MTAKYESKPCWMLIVAFLGIGCSQPKPPIAESNNAPPKTSVELNNQPNETQPTDGKDTTQEQATTLVGKFAPLAPLPEIPIPADNPLTDAKVKLGKLLFFDDRLSGDVGTSCASCHDPRLGWGDGNALSRGYAGTQHWRNSQTLINTAYLSKLFWAGESPSLEA